MSSPTNPHSIILYTYASSPFGKRVEAYLALRGIPYALCVRVRTDQYLRICAGG
jgi:hypothetical protein